MSSSSSFAEGKESLLGAGGADARAQGGGRTGLGEGTRAGGADIEAPEMEALMDDIIVPPQQQSSCSFSDSVATPANGDDDDNTVGDDDDDGGTVSGGTSVVNSPNPAASRSPAGGGLQSAAGSLHAGAATLPHAAAAAAAAASPKAAGSHAGASPTSSRSSRSASSRQKQRKAASSSRSSGSSSSDGSSRRTAADWEEEELGGTVVGKAGRRRSSGGKRRRWSGGSGSGRRRSSGLLDRINEGVRSVAPAVKRRSSSILRHVTAAAAAINPTGDASNINGDPATAAAAAAAAAAAVTGGGGGAGGGGAVKRASLLSVAMRSRTAAAAVEGANYEEEMNAEADVQAMERAMSIWNLEFDDPVLEKAFRRHYRSWVIPRIRVGVQIQMVLNLVFGFMEILCGYTAGAVMAVLFLRLAITLSLTIFSWLTLDRKFHRVMDPLALGFYTLNSFLLVMIDVVGSVWGTQSTSDGASLYFFFEGRWSLPSSLMFVVVVYHISGLRYVYSNIVAWTHYIFLWVAMVSGFCCREQNFGSFFTQSAVLVPILVVLSMISSNTVERQIRVDFVLRCNISSERARADEICASMLPPRVSEMLKNGSAVQEVLQECPQITILFCYITGFKELTTSCDPYDVVDFVNSLFSSFDKCTEYHHVYKLEAIDCSYLCCAGGGQEGEGDNLAPAADRIWDMALTMLAVAAHGSKLPAQVGSTKHGGGAVLKIGVHTGRAVGGVSGVKSYSYHLFGDTVNMASRTASTGLPGRVQLSGAAYKSLSPDKQSACEFRTGVAMKGKGLIDTHLASFDPEGLGKRLWRNFRRFEKMTKVYDPNFQNMGAKETGPAGKKDQAGGVASQEGKLEMIRVKRLKFSLKGSNYEDAQQAGLSDELESEYQHQYNESRLRHFQIVLAVAFVCVSGSALLDYFGRRRFPEVRSRVGMRVYVCGLLFIVLLCSRITKKFVDYLQVSGALVAVVFCVTLNALLLMIPEYHMMDMNIISIITISLLMDLQYTYVLLVNILDVLVYTICINVTHAHKGKDVAGYLLFVYGAALIGSYACNKREREFRYTFLHKRILKDNKVKAEDLLKNMFPNLTHVRTLVRGRRVVDHLEDVTIMFSDLKGYTQWASEESPKEVYRVLNKVYTAFDTHLDALGVYKLDTVGDAFVVVAGLDGFKSKEEHAMAMVKYAFRMLFELERIKTEEDLKFEMRIGLHTGPCIGGVIGRLKPRYLCWGRTPLISNELEAAGTPGKLLVSSATFAQLNKQVLVKRGLKFSPGEPLHVKTFDDMADEEVPTFYIEMDSITAFTILANEIAEDRGMAKYPAGSAVDIDAPDSSGMGEGGRSKSSLLGVSRLKHLFRKKGHHQEEAGASLLDYASPSGGGGWRGRAGAGRNSRSPYRVGPSGLTMTTQSAYMASPPGSPEGAQGPESPAMWDGSEAPTPAASPLPLGDSKWTRPDGDGGSGGGGGGGGGGRGGESSSPKVAGEGNAGDPLLSGGRQRRSSSARVDAKFSRQRRPSSFHVIPGATRGSLERSVVTAAAAAAAAVTEKAAAGTELLETHPDHQKQSDKLQETGATASRPFEGQSKVVEEARKESGHSSGGSGNAAAGGKGEEVSGNGGLGGGGGAGEGEEETGQSSRGAAPQSNAGDNEEESRRTGTGSSSSNGSSRRAAAAAATDDRTSEGSSSLDIADRAEASASGGGDSRGSADGAWNDEGDEETVAAADATRRGTTAWTIKNRRTSTPSSSDKNSSSWGEEGRGRDTPDSQNGSGGDGDRDGVDGDRDGDGDGVDGVDGGGGGRDDDSFVVDEDETSLSVGLEERKETRVAALQALFSESRSDSDPELANSGKRES